VKDFSRWQEYAVDVVTRALATQEIEGNCEAITAALALIGEWERGHPSYYNAQFAIGAFFLSDYSLRVYAWRMVVNGLGGYWQWQSHNGGDFSVALALRHLGILSEGECCNPSQFDVYETHRGCHYKVVKPELLARIVRKYNLPTINLAIGGKTALSESEFQERECMKQKCFGGGVGCDGRLLYESTIKSM